MVFQSYALWPHMTVAENVAFGLSVRKCPKSEIARRVEAALEAVHMSDRAKYKPNQLSGGQQQRVAIARALMNNPPVVFADEPTGNLDTKSSIEIMNLFTELSNEGITIVMVTHEDDIAAYAKRHVVMRDGKVMRDDLNDGTGRKSQDEVARLVKEALA
jgi:putative ABC transport system ATP-binding protein